MRAIAAIVGAFLIFAASAGGQSPDNSDPYSIGLVRGALSTHSMGARVSHIEKNIARCGDRVSIALIKIYGDADLSNPTMVRQILPVIRDAFSQPQFITTGADKQPNVTILLLNHLQQKMVSDPKVQEEIVQTKEFVNKAVSGLSKEQ